MMGDIEVVNDENGNVNIVLRHGKQKQTEGETSGASAVPQWGDVAARVAWLKERYREGLMAPRTAPVPETAETKLLKDSPSAVLYASPAYEKAGRDVDAAIKIIEGKQAEHEAQKPKRGSDKEEKKAWERTAKELRIARKMLEDVKTEQEKMIEEARSTETQTAPEESVVASFNQDATANNSSVSRTQNVPVWRKALNRAKKKFGVKVDGVLNKTIDGGVQIPVMQTPLVFSLLGEKLRPVTMRAQKILDIKREHPNITDDMIKDIPEQLANPIAILDSSPTSTAPKGSYVIITEYKAKGKPIIIAFHTEQKNGVHTINRVASIYDRNGGLAWVQGEIQAGRLRYWDTKRGSSAIYQVGTSGNTNGHTVPPVVQPANLVVNNIATDVDLDKLRASSKYNNTQYQTAPTGTVRGKTDFYREQTIIGVFKTGDKSTLLHELGHVFLQELSEFARLEGTSQDVREDWEKLSAWLGISDIDPSQPMNDDQKRRWTDAHEKFAAHFEAYLMEGVAPTEELKSVFRRFKEWLCRIYQAADRTVCIALLFYLSHSKKYRFHLTEMISANGSDIS